MNDLISKQDTISRIEMMMRGKTAEAQCDLLFSLIDWSKGYTDSRVAIIEWLKGNVDWKEDE